MTNTPVVSTEGDRSLRSLAWVLFVIAMFLGLLLVLGVVIG